MKTRHWILMIFLTIMSSLALTVLMNWPTGRELSRWDQPPEINYQSFDPYNVTVCEGSINWHSLPPSRRHTILICKDASPDYGHMIDYELHNGHEETETYLEKCRVEWTAEGLTFVEASGHRLFVPKKMYIGGR